MLIHYSVQLRRNFGEIPVQIKRFHTDLIATHPIAVIRLYCFVRCGMKEASRYSPESVVNNIPSRINWHRLMSIR